MKTVHSFCSLCLLLPISSKLAVLLALPFPHTLCICACTPFCTCRINCDGDLFLSSSSDFSFPLFGMQHAACTFAPFPAYLFCISLFLLSPTSHLLCTCILVYSVSESEKKTPPSPLAYLPHFSLLYCFWGGTGVLLTTTMAGSFPVFPAACCCVLCPLSLCATTLNLWQKHTTAYIHMQLSIFCKHPLSIWPFTHAGSEWAEWDGQWWQHCLLPLTMPLFAFLPCLCMVMTVALPSDRQQPPRTGTLSSPSSLVPYPQPNHALPLYPCTLWQCVFG